MKINYISKCNFTFIGIKIPVVPHAFVNWFFLLVYFVMCSPLWGSEFSNQAKAFTNPSAMSKKDWHDLEEIDRTWQAALLRVQQHSGSYISSTINNLPNTTADFKTAPTVIYFHGCSGIWPGTYRRIDFLAQSGFSVIAPASFARKKYPQSCDVARNKGGLYRGTLAMRHNDAAYAIKQALALPWVDKNNLFIMGLSEGAIVSATLKAHPEKIKARVVEGWTCHAGTWGEYHGINASQQEPVLALVGKYDPWFQNAWNLGDCGAFMDKSNNSQSVVFKQGYLSRQHELLEHQQVQDIVLEFLRSHLD